MNSFLSKTEEWIDRAFDYVLVLVLVVGIYYAYDSWLVFKGAEADDVLAYRPSAEDPLAYREISDECIAWISIYNTDVDFPVMQAADNSKYLNTDAFGAYSLSGAIFLDSRNDSHFGDDYSLLYGHHMEGEKMFGALDAFDDEEFFKEHRKGEIVIDGKFHEIETFAFSHTDASEGLMFDPTRSGDRDTWIKNNSKFMEEAAGKKVIALSTCKSPTSTIRTILFVSITD